MESLKQKEIKIEGNKLTDHLVKKSIKINPCMKKEQTDVIKINLIDGLPSKTKVSKFRNSQLDKSDLLDNPDKFLIQ